jgi:hypothetical protein
MCSLLSEALVVFASWPVEAFSHDVSQQDARLPKNKSKFLPYYMMSCLRRTVALKQG